MARVCRDAGLFERWDAVYLASHCDGSPLRKAARAAAALARFTAMLAARRVALLHVHLNSDASFWRKAAFVAAARRASVPYILHVHCGNFGRFVRERAGARGQALAKRMLREASAIIALSPQGREELEAIAPGIAVDVIPNPICDTRARAASVQDLGESRSVPGVTILFLGMVTEAKGAFNLLNAWSRIAEKHPGAKLVMAGAGEIEQGRARAEKLGIAGQVEFPGWVDGEAKDRLLAQATVFTLPSHAEAMPMAVLEAMAAGVPVVATAVGGVPWALDEGKAGWLVQPRDIASLASALDRLLTDPQQRETLAAAGRARIAAEFDVGVVLPRLEAIWKRFGNSCQRTPEPRVVEFFPPSTGRTTPTPPR
jgi:glycosyltransferase involved in cell wall biosynthesis